MRESQLLSVFWLQIYSLVLCLSPVFPPFTALKCPGTKTILLNKAPQALDWANPHFQPYLSWTTFMCSSLDPVARSQSMPHALCFSLLLCFKPSSTQRPSLQTTCSKKTFLNFRPSPSLPFPFLPTECKGSVYYLLLCILFKSDAEPTSDLWSW